MSDDTVSMLWGLVNAAIAPLTLIAIIVALAINDGTGPRRRR